MVRRMAGPEGMSATALSQEVGISQPTLSRWLKSAGTLVPMTKPEKSGKGREKSPRRWTAAERLRVVTESSGLSEAELGAFLRREGIHLAQLEEWRKSAEDALTPKKARRPQMSAEAKRIRELEKDLRRKDKALAEVTALLVLKNDLRGSLPCWTRNSQRWTLSLPGGVAGQLLERSSP